MSSTYNPTSNSVDAAAPHRSREDDSGLNNNPFDSSLLSPLNYSQTLSNSASPSYNTNSTPGESLSEYGNYQPSELSEVDDPFFGVDFDAGVHRTDSLPTGLYGTSYQPAGLSPILPDHPSRFGEQQPSETLTTSTYPLSPRLTSIPNTPSPRSETNDTRTKSSTAQHELTTGSHTTQFSPFTPQAPATHPATIQLTPDHSGSSHTSAEGVRPSVMARPERSPHVTVSQWGNQYAQQPNSFAQTRGDSLGTDNSSKFETQQAAQPKGRGPQATALRDEDGMWRSSEITGHSGLDPERRKLIRDEEVPTLREQEEQRHLEEKNFHVASWRSQTGGSSDAEDENPDQSFFHFSNQNWQEHGRPHTDDEVNDIAPVDDAASIRENRLVEGQIYYDFKNTAPNDTDVELLVNHPRHWSDAPSLPYMTDTIFQPQTANDAIRQFNGNAETMSLASRAATWGTRRRSETNLTDIEAVTDGSIFKRLSISKSKDSHRNRQNSIFDQGLDKLANIVRNRGNSHSSNALKRNRSAQNISEVAREPTGPRHNSQGTLAPPTPRNSNQSRKYTPSVNDAFAAMTAPLAAVGATHTHTRGGSVSGNLTTSPKTSPTHLGFMSSAIQRARSRSDLATNEKPGLVGLWRGQGGPPVANLASPFEPEVMQPQQRVKPQPQPQHEPHDQDEDDDDDEDQVDDGDIRVESKQEPIIPNYEGFKAHVRRLNPDMDPRYNWLVSRIAHQQEIRYKNLLDLRVRHSQAIMSRSCGAVRLCMSLGGNPILLDAKGNPRESERNTSGLQVVTDFSGAISDDSNPGEGALTDETFPPGVPMPPCRNLPAEFECQLCFKAKKFQKPSDWTKHVHEDVQPFTCTYDRCKEPKSFKRKADWVRHENERHRHLEWWICQVDDCSHPCYRKDNFLQHLVREHKLPEPKQKTKTAIRKARLTEPAWIMLEQCHHETQNKPQDEFCKFCGKSFNTWKKLTVHLAKHMEHISLPILRLVELRNVDANTIISPVEQILTPVTPISRGKMESASPFNMDSISPHIPMVPHFTTCYDQPTYYPTSAATAPYGMQAPIQHDTNYHQNSMYANSYNVHHMEQPRAFSSLDANNLNTTNHGRGFGSMDSNFSQIKVEQPPGFGSMDSGYSNNLSDHSYNAQQSSNYPMPLDFATSAPPVSGFQAPTMLGISEAGYGFDLMSANGGQNFQVPMSRAEGSASSYGHSPQNLPQNVPQNVPFYGHQ